MSKDSAIAFIEGRKEELFAFSDCIWDHPELKFQEVHAARQYASFLEQEGFRVRRGLCGMPTAFLAEYGSGGPVVAFPAEYDALPGLSQEAGIPRPQPREGIENGHGCGHNLLGTALLAAALAVKRYLEESGAPGTLRLYGAPAEEGGSAKGYMVRDGAFDGVDVAFSWHPDNMDYIVPASLLATMKVRYRFQGTAAHAAMCPQHGRSALDALTLMNVGTQFLREHVASDIRIHYAVTNAGGEYPNVVQKEAEAVYQVRAPHIEQCRETLRRLDLVAQGAATMTETTVGSSFVTAMAEVLPNQALEEIVYRNFQSLGPTPVDEEDRALAARFRETLSEQQLTADQDRIRGFFPGAAGEEVAARAGDRPILDFLFPHVFPTGVLNGSTDVGDLSQAVPTVQISTACFAHCTPAHSWQMAAQGKTAQAHKALLHTGKVLAASAIDILERPELLEPVREEFLRRTGGKKYVPPIPADAKPC